MSSNYRFSVDPGLNGTSVSVWEHTSWDLLVPPIHVQTFKGGLDKESEEHRWVQKARDISGRLVKLYQEYRPCYVHCEYPEMFGGAMGLSVAAKGDLHKIAFVTGLVAEMTWMFKGNFEPIFPREWKGQTSKEMCQRKILHLLPELGDWEDPIDEHGWDAIGIGLFAKGVYKR